MQVQELSGCCERLQKLLSLTEAGVVQLERQRDSYLQTCQELQQESLVLQKTIELLQFVYVNKTKESRKKLEGLLSFGLKTVFKDQDLKVCIEEGLERNKPTLKIKIIQDGKERPLIGSFGGGIVNVVSFILRVLALVNTRMAPILVLDEQFSMVSENYIPNVAELIKKLSTKMGLKVLAVTHKEGFRDYADRIYYVENTTGYLRIKRMEEAPKCAKQESES